MKHRELKPLEIILPFLLSLIAGSASGIGGLIVLLFGEIEERLLGFLMGFAGGVMLIISFLELFVEALTLLSHLEATVAFTTGALLMMVIDLTIPHMETGRWETNIANPRMLKTGLMVAIGISLHNFPEGLVVSAGYTHMPKLGLLIAVMICLHNIPEGIATTTPLIAAGVGRRRAAGIALFSGMTEPIGALAGSFLLSTMGGTGHIIGWGLGLAAGVMTYITVDELIPVAHEYSTVTNKHLISTGLLTGMIFGHLLSVVLNV
ncbi:MAG: ZIP family metal transporter [Candidatus Bathyarchaeota archaeon]|nr:MAG: ZIP family metal transporter [Candidatus Bathyarchaeota archaeon]